MILTEDILRDLFYELLEESGMTFDDWVTESGYTSEWSDKQIYDELPDFIKEWVGDLLINYSWYHGGM